MKVLVTGGAGFIGSNFVRHILTFHPHVAIANFDKLTYAGNAENLADVAENPRYQYIRGDIADREAVEAVFGTWFDAIVHFAAETHVDRSIEDAAPFLRTNVVGSYCLLEAAKRFGTPRFIHISTDEVYGSAGSVYNVSSGMPQDNLSTVRLILRQIEKPASLIEFVMDRPGHDRRYVTDSSQIRGELGWEPEVEFEEGIRRTIAWYKANPEWLKHACSDEYQGYYERHYYTRRGKE